MRSIHAQTLSRVVLALLLGLSPVVLHAATAEPVDMSAVKLEPQQQNGITYLSGGIGEDESKAIQQQVKGYSLHMTFSAGPANEYTSDVNVVIQTTKGHEVLSLSQVGPIVYVKLPAGKYLIIGSRNGHEERQTVAIEGNASRNVVFHWKDASLTAK